MYPFRTISLLPEIPKRISGLSKLAYNLWFSWHPETQALFAYLDVDLWKQADNNPVEFLLNIKQEKLQSASNDQVFLNMYDKVMLDFATYLQGSTWYEKNYPGHEDLIAYFSAEFGIHESTPIYSGGLGLLAGDHCKAASDLGIPLVGVGILYKQGYFCQQINGEGWQEVHNSSLDPSQMPIKPACLPNGQEVIITLEFPERLVYVKVWEQNIGRIKNYYLDTDLALNSPHDRLLTSKLYIGDQSIRLSQEIILGFGGVKALRALNISPNVWHINEGHAAFVIVQRIRELVQKGLDFPTACEVVKANTIFTTHTPVPAGHDVFNVEMIDHYFGHLYEKIGINRDSLISLCWDSQRNGFNMSKLALNYSSFVNGVSKIHCQSTKKIFADLYADIPFSEMPIHYITNGIHTTSWTATEMQQLFQKHLGSDWIKNITQAKQWRKVYDIPDEELWQAHLLLKEKLLAFARENILNRLNRNFETAEVGKRYTAYLKKDTLLICFARRFATYKRATLLLRDKERLAKLVNNPQQPVVIMFAGKAHPEDRPGQQMIKQLCDLEKDPRFQGKILFLENYDINLARHLVQGADVLLNTPRYPLEASGTSGQKAAVNGVINCSTLDGWWPEAYNGQNGFGIGIAKLYPSEDLQDQEDVSSLFELLEQNIIPSYYERINGLPIGWINLMKNCLATIPWYFSTLRMVKEYYTHYYLKAAQREKEFTANNFLKAKEQQQFKERLLANWANIESLKVQVNTTDLLAAGKKLELTVPVKLGQLKPQEVIVEILYGKVQNQSLENPQLIPMNSVQEMEPQLFLYKGSINLTSGTSGYALRIRPNSINFAHPFELPLIKWINLT
ncbi:alpha-glucan family phosphorylase [Bacillota bacterium LX-D]|nr:alpha-glucan family phosphorylase [Bacillota bacterium LX-D]